LSRSSNESRINDARRGLQRHCEGTQAGQTTERKDITVARTSWFDEKAEHPVIQEQVQKLKAFTDALADGVVTKQEVYRQEQRLISAMKYVDKELGDELHAKVTTLLVEMSAYNVMRLLHELQAERARIAFGNA
jgi:hypothetical protein